MKRPKNHPNPLLEEPVFTGAEMQEELARIEADPGLQQMARDSERAIREGRTFTLREVKEAMRERGRGRAKLKDIILRARRRHG